MAFVLFLAYLIVVYLRPGDWVPALAGVGLVDGLLMGATFLVVLDVARTRGRSLVHLPHNRVILLFFATVVLSHLANGYFGGAVHAATVFVVNVILYFVVINVVKSTRRLQLVLAVLTFLAVLLAVQGVQQAARGVGWAGQGLALDGRITWVGIFEDPNDLALVFVVAVPILLAQLTGRGFIALKWIGLACLGVVLYAVYLTNSRGGMLAIMVAMAFFFVKRSRHALIGGMLGGTAALAAFVFGPTRLGKLSVEEASAAGRLDAWYYGFQLLKSNPLFGVGHEMFTDAFYLTAHNSFVLAFAELGLLGYFCWIAVLYTTYRALSVVQGQPGVLGIYSYGLQAALVGFCAGAFFLSRTYILIPYLLMGLSGAAIQIARRQTPQLTFRLTGRDWRHIALLGIGMLLLLETAMKTWL